MYFPLHRWNINYICKFFNCICDIIHCRDRRKVDRISKLYKLNK